MQADRTNFMYCYKIKIIKSIIVMILIEYHIFFINLYLWIKEKLLHSYYLAFKNNIQKIRKFKIFETNLYQ